MRSLSDISLIEMVPPSLRDDPFVAALVDVFDEEFHALIAAVEKLYIFADLVNQSDEVLDELAWQFNVDFYDQTLSKPDKVALIVDAIYWHSVKGTPRAIERVIEIAFGTGTVEEWFEYGGDPFMFRVRATGGSFPTAAKVDTLKRMVEVVKRASTVLEAIIFEQSADQAIYFGGSLHIGQTITQG